MMNAVFVFLAFAPFLFFPPFMIGYDAGYKAAKKEAAGADAKQPS